MKIDVYLNPVGLEALAKGETLYSSSFDAFLENYTFVPKGSKKIGTLDWEPGDKAAVTRDAVQALQSELQEFRVQTLRAEQDLVQRINNLLALEGPSA